MPILAPLFVAFTGVFFVFVGAFHFVGLLFFRLWDKRHWHEYPISLLMMLFGVWFFIVGMSYTFHPS